MIVLHILLGILKIVGILLLVLFVLLFLILLSLLLCPVKYRAEARKDSETFGGQAKVSWMFHLFSAKVWYESQDKTPGYSIKIFGISVKELLEFLSRLGERRRKRAERKKASKSAGTIKTEENHLIFQTTEDSPKKAAEESKTEEKLSETETARERDNADEVLEKPSVFSEFWEVLRGILQIFRRILQIPGKVLKALNNFRLTAEKICDKMKKVKEFLESDHFIRGKNLVLTETKKIVLHVRPRKVKGYLKFGTEDPFLTGEILAAAGIFYPLYGENFTVEPYFDQNILEGSVFIRGRVYGIVFVLFAWKLFRDSDIRYMVKRFK